jgi:dephospho-CoA kinase
VTKIKVIGLTGGIACGKSSVAAILRKLGISVIDADQIAHQVIAVGTQAYIEIVAEFGSHIVAADGRINRQALGKIVFNDQIARAKLESITHPVIINKIKELIRCYAAENHKLVIVETPLLFETGLENLFDDIWVVSADPGLQLERLMKLRNLNRAEAEQRLTTQLPLRDKEGKADIIIYNNREFSDLESEVIRLVERL